ncbi:MAG TPA: YbfB/YjiJ family MFS transporter [Burkholderiales bacterium]|nr:YbfB/YjiJ family MFS transporter [Burkholderiales bacterium]
MTSERFKREYPRVPDATVVVIGVLSLAVAMGIGRFAFTPLLPLMLRDGSIDAGTGAEWAAANYVGYLVGALTASRFAADPRRGLRLSLLGVALSTLAVACLNAPLRPLVGMVLRIAAGIFSAWTLVCASSWCLAELARREASQLGAWVFTGVGVGIAAVGALAWLGGRQTSSALWLEAGLLAAVGALFVWLRLRTWHEATQMASSGLSSLAPSMISGHWPLVLCYGAFGFGYIIPATFLPAMARQQVSDPLVFGLTWPLFGLAAALAVAGAARWLRDWPRRRVWALAQTIMTLGTALPIATQALWSLAVSAVLVGGTFMVVTMAGLQLARERVPTNPTPLLARMTVAFAVGQIAGPLLVRLIGFEITVGPDALLVANGLATALLAISALWLWRSTSGRGE